MLNFARELYEELLSKLEETETSGDPHSYLPGYHLGLIQSYIERLKEKLKSHVFSAEEAETVFFKAGIPLLFYLSIYYAERFELEMLLLFGTAEEKEAYFDRQLRKMHDYFRAHAEFYAYSRSGRTDLDKHYYLRSSVANRESPDLLSSLADPACCTRYSLQLAHFLAYARLAHEIQCTAMGKTGEPLTGATGGEDTTWTDSKAGIVELGYGIKAKGAVNNGNATVKQIIQRLEIAFNVPISNHSRTFQEMLTRGSGYTTYIDGMRTALLKYIDDIEDKNIR
jgi:hypothetical protein